MTTDADHHELIDELVDDFMTRQHAGGAPTVTEYCERHPELANEIRELFPLLGMMESAKSDSTEIVNDDKIPESIGDYRIIREIGRGGMGVVYEAHHTMLGRSVALKVLTQRLSASKRARTRFERESRAVAKLHHTNIVPLFEVGEDDGQLFLAMQLIPGDSLDRLIGQSKFESAGSSRETGTHPSGKSGHASIGRQTSSGDGTGSGVHHSKRIRTIVDITLQIAEALQYARERGIIHRDVKPSNILLDEHGVAWLTDFGLAKTDEDTDEGLTQTGDFLGTLRYMAPERFRGECDGRSDIYALGLTLYEMLTGKEAFGTSDRLSLMRMIDESEVISPRSHDPRIPRDLETIVLKSINKDPASRYKSAKAMAEDLGRFQQDRPIKARRHNLIEQFVRWSRRNKNLAASLAAIAALLLVIALGATAMSIHSNSLRAEADLHRDKAEQDLYFSHMNLAGQSASQTISSESLGPRLAQWVPERVGRDLRGWEWYYLRSLTEQMAYSSPRLFKDGFHWCWSVDYCPDGTEFVNTVNGWGIQIRNSSGEVLREKLLGSARFVHWSPDGSRIAVAGFGSPAKVLICDSQSLEIVIEIECADHGEIECARWSPDSLRIAVGGDAKFADAPFNLRIYDAATGELDQSLETSARPVCVDWSPDGSRIASGQGDGAIRVWNTSTGKILAELESNNHPYDIRWNSGGTSLAIAGDTPQCWHVDAENEHQPAVVKAETIGARSLAWHPLMDQLAVGCTDGSIQLLDGNTLKTTRTLVGNRDQIWSLAWRKGGTQLASSSLYEGRIEIWNVGPDNQNFILYPQHGNTQFAWMPDGDSLAGMYDIWNLSTGGHLKMELDGHFQNFAVNLSDGRLAFGGQRQDVVVRTSDGLESPPMPGQVEWTNAIGWSRDGQLAALSIVGQLVAWDVNGTRTVEKKQLHDGGGMHLLWSPDDRRVATTASDNFIRVWDSSTWDLVWENRDEDHPVYQVCWNADGTRLATSHDGILKIWNSATGEHLETLDDIQESFRSLDWSPDGSRMAVGSDSSLTIWDIQQKRVALRLTPGCDTVRWNPDGQRLAIGSPGTIRILDARSAYEADSLER